ncbi:MAG: hypothetical protein FWG60_04015 [Methanomassiliicoccaceae archaeon]|nr:hypothetical protein [Methanomassiliicoccaceae archaeon]
MSLLWVTVVTTTLCHTPVLTHGLLVPLGLPLILMVFCLITYLGGIGPYYAELPEAKRKYHTASLGTLIFLISFSNFLGWYSRELDSEVVENVLLMVLVIVIVVSIVYFFWERKKYKAENKN